jgi:hypothetical protein
MNKLVPAGVFQHSCAHGEVFHSGVGRPLQRLGATLRRAALVHLAPASKPTSIAKGDLADLLRTPVELRIETALLRQT